MRILISILLFISLSSKGITKMDTLFFRNKEINLQLNRLKSDSHKTNGWITLAAGIGFTTVGILMERDRVKSNIPDGWFGYSKSKRMFYDYSIITIGVTLSIGGGIMISK